MYDFEKGDLFIDIADPGDTFVFEDKTNTIFISIGGILRFSVAKYTHGEVIRNVYTFYSADGNTIVTNTEFIDEGVIENAE
jgi:hypothetical protein